MVSAPQQARGNGDAEGDRLARTGLGRNQQIGFNVALARHLQLDRREIFVALRLER
jgi:hypothetical protein